MNNGTETDFNFVFEQYKNAPPSQEKLQLSVDFANYLTKVKDETRVRKGVDEMMKFRNQIPEQYRGFTDPAFKQGFSKISKAKRDEGIKELADYINGLIK